MASATSFPFQISPTFSLDYPLSKAISFSVNHKDRSIVVLNENASTIEFGFRDIQKLHEGIDFFLKQTQIRPSLFHVQNVHASIHQDENHWTGSIELEFETESEKDLCAKYCNQFYNPPDFVSSGWRLAQKDIYMVEIMPRKTSSKEAQIVRMSLVFHNIMTRLGESGIMDALRRKNSFFQEMDFSPQNNNIALNKEEEEKN